MWVMFGVGKVETLKTAPAVPSHNFHSKVAGILPGRGLEPLRIAPPDPKSGASANFATLASLNLRTLRIEMRN
jgi:hypothetical protein